MEGIPSGLGSITPILPETMLISSKGGINTPPVEIMPVPDNSFMSGDATADMLNNAFTLSLDIKGYNGDDEADGKPVPGAPAGSQPPAEEPTPAAVLENAYKLSLGGRDEAVAASEMARELARMKNYELLGKTTPRQTYRPNPETRQAQPNAPGAHGAPGAPGRAGARINDSVRNLMERMVGQEALFTGEEPSDVPAASVPVLRRELLLTETETAPQASSARPGQVDGNPAPAPNALSFLSPSDYEAILSLEPDLQEALLNMLGEGNIILPPAERKDAPPAPPAAQSADASAGTDQGTGKAAVGLSGTDIYPAGAALKTDTRTAASPGFAMFPGGADTLNAARPPQDYIGKPPLTVQAATQGEQAQDGARLMFTSDDGAERLLSGLAAAVAAHSAVPSAGMANLQKITELPYSLYLFGGVNPEKRPEEEEEEPTPPEKRRARPAGRSALLRLSEAVKMASVLHNLYHGGSGLFPEETPWYAPYARYAVQNGIIQSDDFDDFNGYATRAETAYIFSGSVPREELPAVKRVRFLTDVAENTGYGGSIFLLLRAGVLLLSDRTGRFYPDSPLKRAEAAAIIGRIATPSDRKTPPTRPLKV